MSKSLAKWAALIHIGLFVLFVVYLQFGTDDGQSRLLWTIWLPIDFPVSMITLLGLDLTQGGSELMSAFRRFLPFFVHGILGPIWWYFLVSFVGKMLGKLGR
jgi:hypothetical protein